MELKDQVCSFELAKRLKELGVKQESYFYWYQNDYDEKWQVVAAEQFMCDCDYEPESMHGCDIRDIAAERVGGPGKYDPDAVCSAFTVAELGELLPREIVAAGKVYDRAWVQYTNKAGARGSHDVSYMKWADGDLNWCFNVRGDTEADARAKMLIYLLENGLLTLDA